MLTESHEAGGEYDMKLGNLGKHETVEVDITYD